MAVTLSCGGIVERAFSHCFFRGPSYTSSMRFWFCLFSFFFCALPIRAFDLASRVQEITLANGMKWIVVRRPGVPVFSGKIVGRAGGLNETPGKTGLAHMFEHMAFKGSPDITKDEI